MRYERVVVGTGPSPRRTIRSLRICQEDWGDGDDFLRRGGGGGGGAGGEGGDDDRSEEPEREPDLPRLPVGRRRRAVMPRDLSALVDLLSHEVDEVQFHSCRTGPSFWDLWASPPPALRRVRLHGMELFECRGVDAPRAVSVLARWIADPMHHPALERLSIQYGFVAVVEEEVGGEEEEGDGRGRGGESKGRGVVDPILEALGGANAALRELTIRTGGAPLRIGREAARAIGRSKCLERLTLSGLDIPVEDATYLAWCLRGNAALRSLDLASAHSKLPHLEFHRLVRSHNWRLEGVGLAGVPGAVQRRIDRWAGTLNADVRRIHDGWEKLVARHRRLEGADIPGSGSIKMAPHPPSRPPPSSPGLHRHLPGRPAAALPSQNPSHLRWAAPGSGSGSGSGSAAAAAAVSHPKRAPPFSSPVLPLLPRVLHSLQSKPTLTYALLRDRHLDELVAHWRRGGGGGGGKPRHPHPHPAAKAKAGAHGSRTGSGTSTSTSSSAAPLECRPRRRIGGGASGRGS